jgi:iron complex transport system substrate-binding protein
LIAPYRITLAALLSLAVGLAHAGDSPRIVTLAPHLAEMVYAAGAGDRLVGSVAYSDFPPAARDLPLVGDAFGVDAERLVALAPDLVLAWQGGNPAAVIDRVRALGIETVAFPATGLEDVPGQLERIGALAGTPEVARQAADRYRARLERLRSAHRGAPVLRVFYQISEAPLYTVGKRHPITELIELCGGRNVFADNAGSAFIVSLEAVLARDPQVVLVGTGAPAKTLEMWRSWENLSAAAAGNLLMVNADHVARPGPRLAIGAEEVCAALEGAREAIGLPAGSGGSAAVSRFFPEHFTAALVTGEHAGEDEEQVGQPVEVPQGSFVDGLLR